MNSSKNIEALCDRCAYVLENGQPELIPQFEEGFDINGILRSACSLNLIVAAETAIKMGADDYNGGLQEAIENDAEDIIELMYQYGAQDIDPSPN
jgi:hypothetical protein